MKKRTGIWMVIAMLAVAAACAPGAETAESEGLSGLPPVAVLITHQVADYGVWKSVFDDHIQARKDASCLGHYL